MALVKLCEIKIKALMISSVNVPVMICSKIFEMFATLQNKNATRFESKENIMLILGSVKTFSEILKLYKKLLVIFGILQ